MVSAGSIATAVMFFGALFVFLLARPEELVAPKTGLKASSEMKVAQQG